MPSDQRKRPLPRLAGVLLLLLGILGLALCGAGIVECWVWRMPVTERVLRLCGRADRDLGIIGDGLDRVRTSLEDARTQLAAVPRNVKEGTPEPLRMMALQLLAPKLAPQLKENGRTLETVADATVVVSHLLQGMEGFPLGPAAPLDAEQLREAARRVQRLGATAEKLMVLTGDDNQGKGAEVQTAVMEEGISRALTVIGDLREQVRMARDRVTEVRAHFARWVTWAAVGATVLLVWAGLGQVSLLLHGWALCKRPAPALGSPA